MDCRRAQALNRRLLAHETIDPESMAKAILHTLGCKRCKKKFLAEAEKKGAESDVGGNHDDN